MALSLILTIKISSDSSKDIMLIKDLKNKEVVDFGDYKYNMILKDISFMKKMYEPGLITANFQFKINGPKWIAIGKDALETEYKNKEVTLRYGDASQDAKGNWIIKDDFYVCTGYYVHEVQPLYKSDAQFVTFVMYSVDKKLTLTKGCNSFTGMRLGRDILETNKINFPLPYDSTQYVGYNYNNLKHLCVNADHKEALFPYLVQYNESYYDFLARTCNRWGEFLYFENGMLNIGYGTGEKNVETFSTYNFCDLNEKNTLTNSTWNYAMGALYDKHMLDNNLEKGKYDDPTPSVDSMTAKLFGKLLTSDKNVSAFTIETAIDEGIARGQAEERAANKNADFDKEYFKYDKNSDPEERARFNSSYTKCNEFSDFTPRLTSDLYKNVVEGEFDAAQDAICINLDTTLQNLKLGDILTIKSGSKKYIVVQVNTIEKEDLVIDFVNKKSKTVKTTTFQVIASKQNKDSYFYPTMLPAGHIRTSGPQRAQIINGSTEDPTKQGRVQVKFPWQGDAPIKKAPWLEYTHPGGKGTGTYNRHYVNEQVLVAFANGNVERPYIVGSLSTEGQSAPGSILSNDIVHVTPGGQAIKMSDGTGAGATAFVASMMPSFKMVQGFYPGVITGGLNTDDTHHFEGSVELSDKFGIYSIKGSTDGRNISIKSPFGDIKLNAFTGITISAPNGDVKIQGKNVTIEAGNNLTLTSGKNIRNGFLCSYGESEYQKWDFAKTAVTALSKKIAATIGGFIDFSLLRNTIEVFMKPVEGKLTVHSNRFLALEAGTGKTGYPADTFTFKDYQRAGLANWRSTNKKKVQEDWNKGVVGNFGLVKQMATACMVDFFTKYNTVHSSMNDLKGLITQYTDTITTQTEQLPCRDAEAILNDLWTNPNIAINAQLIGFQNALADADASGNLNNQSVCMLLHVPQGSTNDASGIARAKTAHQEGRQGLLDEVSFLRDSLKGVKEFSIKSYVDGAGFDANVAAALKDDLLEGSFIDMFYQDMDWKMFRKNASDGLRNEQARKLAQRVFIEMIERIYGFTRSVTGGINGVGAAAPSVPDVFGNSSEKEWSEYVNSIQQMPKAPSVTTWSDSAKDFLAKNLGDPILQQLSFPDLFCDGVDCWAFGADKKGQILFTNGETGTMLLDNDIRRANVDRAEDSALYGQGFVSGIRNHML